MEAAAIILHEGDRRVMEVVAFFWGRGACSTWWTKGEGMEVEGELWERNGTSSSNLMGSAAEVMGNEEDNGLDYTETMEGMNEYGKMDLNIRRGRD
ncbi:unnamed protein product [Calypogeia fissa]